MKYRRIAIGLCCSGAMLALILDGKTAIGSARAGIALCLYTVIPSLLPFFFLTAILVQALSGADLSLLRPLARLCGLPEGASPYLIPAFLGGYPMGARAIAEGVEKGWLDRNAGSRMLLFCSNAGPAFLFGMLGPLFPENWMAWALWGIHILSAVLIGTAVPQVPCRASRLPPDPAATVSDAMTGAVRAMAVVSGWVICFHILTGFCRRWFLGALSPAWQAGIAGILELTNGCSLLAGVEPVALRFILAAGLLGFGGISVLMQTASVLGSLPLGNYLAGKLFHSSLSMLLAWAVIAGKWQCFGVFILCGLVIFWNFQRNSGICQPHAV